MVASVTYLTNPNDEIAKPIHCVPGSQILSLRACEAMTYQPNPALHYPILYYKNLINYNSHTNYIYGVPYALC